MLKSLVIINTLRCNFKCAHCIRGYPDERTDFPMELLPKLLMEARPFGAAHVSLTGGEPFLHPQFEEMVETVVKAGYTWHFVSNGWETKPYVPLLEKYGESVSHVALSLDGASPEIHDAIRGRSGSFERVMQAVKNYQEMKFPILWNVCLNKKNKHQLEDILHMAEKMDISMMNVLGTNPTPWNSELQLTDEESLACYDQALKISEYTEVNVSIRSSLRARGGISFCRQLWFTELSVNANGEVIFCCDTLENGAVIGSLQEHSLDVLLKDWLETSNRLQEERINRIQNGNMGTGFDNCMYCNQQFLSESISSVSFVQSEAET